MRSDGIYPKTFLCGPTQDFLVVIFIIFLATLKHVAKTVAKVDLSNHVVDVVFVLFDENGKTLFLVITKNLSDRGFLVDYMVFTLKTIGFL